jgi:predicted RNA-binding Zn-ribbon protein involved in translation (DUF1610 family)
MADIQIENLMEYRDRDNMHVAEFEFMCPNCGDRHNQRVVQADPIYVVTVIAPCGFTAPAALAELEHE